MFLILSILSTTLSAKTGFPIPRFVSLRSNEVNVRVGPGFHFPLRWKLIRKEPVEITAEFNNWRKIRCQDGAEGWTHQSMLSGKRIIKTIKDTIVRRGAFDKARPVAKIEKNVICSIDKCKGNWCKVTIKDIDGWIEKESFWGLYEKEKI